MDIEARIAEAKSDLLEGRWQSDPDLRAQTDWILSLPPVERLRLVDSDIAMLRAVRPVAPRSAG